VILAVAIYQTLVKASWFTCTTLCGWVGSAMQHLIWSRPWIINRPRSFRSRGPFDIDAKMPVLAAAFPHEGRAPRSDCQGLGKAALQKMLSSLIAGRTYSWACWCHSRLTTQTTERFSLMVSWMPGYVLGSQQVVIKALISLPPKNFTCFNLTKRMTAPNMFLLLS